MLAVVVAAEYRRRVTTRAFLLTTFLGPLAVLAIGGGAVAIVAHSVDADSEQQRRVAVLDHGARLLARLQAADGEQLVVSAAPEPLEAARQAVRDGRFDSLVVLPREAAEPGGPTTLHHFTARPPSLGFERDLRTLVLDAVRRERLSGFDLPPRALDAIDERLRLVNVSLSPDGEGERSGIPPDIAGLAMSFVLFMIMAIYGGMVMQAAMEEKTSRMAEILVSSVRPFHLMMGKILAVAGMAATQFAVWLAMLAAAGVVAGWLLSPEDLAEIGLGRAVPAEDADAGPTNGGNGFGLGLRRDVAAVALVMLPLGYLINASLFAALGAMYETAQEAQMGVAIAMAPLFATIVIVQTLRLAPESALIGFTSLFPLTAPVIMPARMLIDDVPTWQVAASLVLCAGAAAGVTWLAGRIFRLTLLRYGQRPGPRDVLRILRSD